MENKCGEIIRKVLMREIRRAKRMAAYTMEFEDKTATGRWKMTVFQLECLYKKLDAVLELTQSGISDDKIEELLDKLDKELFMEGP